MLPDLASTTDVEVMATASPERLAALEAKEAAAITRGRAAATLRAYRSDWADFSTWCRTVGVAFLPANPGTVASYVAELADRLTTAGPLRCRPSPGAWPRSARATRWPATPTPAPTSSCARP